MDNIEVLRKAILKKEFHAADEQTLAKQLAEYDFSMSTTSKMYNEKKGLDRFFTYELKGVKSWIMNDKNGRITYENAFYQRSHLCVNKVFEGTIIEHPDSNSDLLQEIYKCLWDVKYLELCKDKKKICGETMNSVCITLDELVSCDKDEVSLFKNMNNNKNINSKPQSSVTYIMNRYYDSYDEKISETLNKNNDLNDFVNVYHTLGNFIPFPVDCNGPRADGGTKDYWDLTLWHIYKYYHGKSDALERIYKNEKTRNTFKSWLDKFDDGSDAWKNFVEKNYMSAFLDEKTGEPEALWSEHFDGIEGEGYDPLPKDTEKCNEYFRKAAECINKRGEEMANALFDKLREEILLWQQMAGRITETTAETHKKLKKY